MTGSLLRQPCLNFPGSFWFPICLPVRLSVLDAVHWFRSAIAADMELAEALDPNAPFA